MTWTEYGEMEKKLILKNYEILQNINNTKAVSFLHNQQNLTALIYIKIKTN